MTTLPFSQLPACTACTINAGVDFDFTMAFQPIIDLDRRAIFAYEALVRGPDNQPAGDILGRVNAQNRYRFDQLCRAKAIELASTLNISTLLSINFMPNAVYRAETCLRTTLQVAARLNFPREQIIFEITEDERVSNHVHLRSIVQEYKRQGFKTAIDDFGAGTPRTYTCANWDAIRR